MADRRFNYESKEGFSDVNIIGTKPLMTDKECECITSYLKPHHTFFEWGSGGSTLYFPYFVKEYYSVEHFRHWERLVKHKLKEHPDIKKKVELYYIPNDLPYEYTDKIERYVFESYIKSIGLPGHKRYDIILVDGENRTRGYCAEEALSYMDKDSILFIHDYYKRPLLAYLESYFNVIEKIEDGATLVVMKKK